MRSNKKAKKDLHTYLGDVNYDFVGQDYVPSTFALEFMAFIKLVNGDTGEENTSPEIHFQMIDALLTGRQNLYVSFRGSAKTSVLHEYMKLFVATFGGIPGFGKIDVGMYVSDTIDNGVRSMRLQLQYRWENSEFLQKYVPDASFISDRWEFTNIEGNKVCFRGFGANTGVRGFKEYGRRPCWLGLDDLLSDKNADSPTIIKDIEKIIYRGARQAMQPGKRMTIWTGTPFNKSDPLYAATTQKSWQVKVFPICEKFPCAPEEFRGAWEDRFSYDFVNAEYESLKESGQVSSFNQELMLSITSDEERLVQPYDLVWYSRDDVIRDKSNYNFYITTDFATTDNDRGDFTVIGVWAYSANGDWLLVDGVCARQLMDKTLDDLFAFVNTYRPLSVGIEINGQQKGFIALIRQQMITRKTFFAFAQQKGVEGIRRSKGKLSYFKQFLPVIKAKRIWLPSELEESPLVEELVEELTYVTDDGFKSVNDDACDMLTMLLEIKAITPSTDTSFIPVQSEDGIIMELDNTDDAFDEGSSYVF